ncbi:MAG: PH domain-containing protein [Ilumatobacteraceae bacterium]
MPYPQKLLNPGEETIVDLHPHWWYFAKQVLRLAVFFVLAIVVAVFTGEGSISGALRWISIVLVVISGFGVALRWLSWVTTYFVVTSDRVIFRSGIISRRGVEIPLGRVNNVLFNQSLLERVIGAGDLLIESGGESGQQTFTDVRNPDRVQNAIHAAIDRLRD